MSLDPTLVIGLLLATAGWVVLPLAVRIVGLLLGGTAGILIVDIANLTFSDFHPSSWLYGIAALLLGFLGMGMAQKLFKLMIFLVGCVTALALKGRLDETLNLSESLSGGVWGAFPETFWFTLLFVLLGGLLLAFLRRYLIVVLSGFAGAVLIARAGGLEEKWLTIAIVGMAFQSLCLSLFPRRKRDPG